MALHKESIGLLMRGLSHYKDQGLEETVTIPEEAEEQVEKAKKIKKESKTKKVEEEADRELKEEKKQRERKGKGE